MKLKTILLTALIFTFSITCYAGSADKEYKKILEKHDVPPEAKGSNKNNPSAYWEALLNNNDQLVKFASDMHKLKGAEEEVFAEVAAIPKFNAQCNSIICEDMQGFCDTLLLDMGISGERPKCSLYIVHDDEVNAFTALTDDGFAMCVTTGFVAKKGCTYEILMAAVAHEFAHGAYFHYLQNSYAKAKRKRRNLLIGGVISELSAMHKSFSYARGQEPMPQDDMQSLYNRLNSETARYALKFGREQEYEADIVAFRFMQWIGKEDAFIDLLKFMGTDYDYLNDEWSDHPTIAARIGLAEYMKLHPEIKNKEIDKLRKKANKDKK